MRRRNKGTIRRTGPVTVGVRGAGYHVGTTHVMIMLGTYLAMVKGYRVAVVEMNEGRGLRQAEEIRNSLCPPKRAHKKRLTMYGPATDELISELLMREGDEQYDFLLMDCGNANDPARNESGNRMFSICNRRIMVANLSWWRLAECTTYLECNRSASETDCREMVGTDVIPEAAAYLKKEYGVKVRTVPVEPDPFFLHADTLAFCEDVAGDW